MARSFDISKKLVWQAYLRVKANKGAEGVVCATRYPRLFAAVPFQNENHSILNGSFRTTAPAHGAMPTQA